MKNFSKLFLAISIFIVSVFCSTANAQLSPAEIDRLAERTMKEFEVPGISIGIIKDGKLIHAKGYGVKSTRTNEKVDENTLFCIASNSKAFTAASIALLVDEGRLKWDDKVTQYIPEFRMYNAYVTEEFTIRDLLSHRSGLGLGAGDLMWWPDSNDFTVKDVLSNIRYLKPVSAFRTKYDYDNLLYIIAGEVVERVTGKSWEEFVETRIMQPLAMDKSAGTYSRLPDKSNIASAHAPVEGKLQQIPHYTFTYGNALGGIFSNITDMARWMQMQLDSGKYNNGKKLFSEKVHAEMWTPQTIIPVRNRGSYNTNFNSYGLGWFVSDVKGYKQVSHTGGMPGMVTQVTLIPDLELGIIVLTNQQSGAAFTAITSQIKDSYLGINGIDRVKEMSDRVKAGNEKANKVVDDIWKVVKSNQKKSPSKPQLNQYTGTFHDEWFGDVSISERDGKLYFSSLRSKKFNGQMHFYKGNTFVAKWNDRSMDADAFVMFDLDQEGKAIRMRMKSISPLTDFSFDFHDLDFNRVK